MEAETDKIYREKYFISAGDTDASGKLSLPLLTARIIDIATAHANALGIGNPTMADKNLGWVISRLTIEMECYPPVNTEYTLETWVESWNRHFSVRSFRILSQDNRTLGHARSIWMVMNTQTHENGGLSHLHIHEGIAIPDANPIARQEKHLLLIDDENSDVPKGSLRCNRPTTHYRFQYCDLDAYRHVNTVKYVILLLNQFTLADFDSTYPRRLELSFLREGHYGETVDIRRYDEGLQSSFLIADGADGDQILYARILRQ